jgi:flagellar basal-body rod protein FlgF
MDNALYVGLSRQMYLRRELDIVANNIANVDTTGFKVESLLAKSQPAAPAMTADGPRPVRYVAADGVARDFGQGPLRQTGAPLDLAIEGRGFFKVQTADGERYTRDGRFTLNDVGQITNQAGLAVLDEGGGPITIDPELGPIAIGKDGTVTQGDERVGKIGLVDFADLSVLEKMGDNLLRNTSNLQPTPPTDLNMRQGFLEGSNVKPILEITRMMEITRAYTQISKMMDTEGDLTRRSIERLGRAN